MKDLPLPDLQLLHEWFDYDPETGKVKRKKATRNRKAGTLVGTPRNPEKPYLSVGFMKNYYLLHRLIWKLYYGEDIAEGYQIDHINRDHADNRICNLRLLTNNENCYNRGIYKTNKSGVTGVYYQKDRKSWRAKIGNKVIGHYKTMEEAIDARRRAETM
jgi:hypothetical protein